MHILTSAPNCSQPMVALLSSQLSASFDHGNLFSNLDSDLSPAGSAPLPLRWTIPSASHSRLSDLNATARFALLGSISRSLGRAYEAAAASAPNKPASLQALDQSLQSLLELCERAQAGWRATRWSDLARDTDLVCSPDSAATLSWTILKTLLFSITLVLSCVLVLASPKPGQNPTRKQVDLAGVALRMLGATYFVASKFGPEGFGAWKGVWVGLVEVTKGSRDEKGVVGVLDGLLPPAVGVLHEKTVDRATATFHLNTAEQLVPSLPRAQLEFQVMQVCKPYLSSSEYRDPFESAHSVVLAIFATQPDLALELAPWYTALLLELTGKEGTMNPTQLRLAFTTMVRAVSGSDDALALWAVQELVDAIKALPTSPPTTSHTQAPVTRLAEDARFFSAEPTRLENEHAPPSTKDESLILRLSRGALLLTLIDQSAAVNLYLLERLLGETWDLIKEEGDQEAREALARAVFVVLSEGLSKEKRATGVGWWLSRGEELVR